MTESAPSPDNASGDDPLSLPDAVPNPPEGVGARGNQEASTSTALAAETLPAFSPQTLHDAIGGIAAHRPRSMGTEAAATMVAASFFQANADLAAARREVAAHRQELRDKAEECSVLRVDLAVSRERLGASAREKTLRNVCIVAGTAVTGFGLDLVRSSSYVFGASLIVIGASLLLFGWVGVKGGGSK